MSSTIGWKVSGLTYTKVQYRYGQKNWINSSDVDYLKWLRAIGYAEDPMYIREVAQVLKKIF